MNDNDDARAEEQERKQEQVEMYLHPSGGTVT